MMPHSQRVLPLSWCFKCAFCKLSQRLTRLQLLGGAIRNTIDIIVAGPTGLTRYCMESHVHESNIPLASDSGSGGSSVGRRGKVTAGTCVCSC